MLHLLQVFLDKNKGNDSNLALESTVDTAKIPNDIAVVDVTGGGKPSHNNGNDIKSEGANKTPAVNDNDQHTILPTSHNTGNDIKIKDANKTPAGNDNNQDTITTKYNQDTTPTTCEDTKTTGAGKSVNARSAAAVYDDPPVEVIIPGAGKEEAVNSAGKTPANDVRGTGRNNYQTKSVSVPCKMPNGKWEVISFNVGDVRKVKTELFEVQLHIQTSFMGRGTYNTDTHTLTGK